MNFNVFKLIKEIIFPLNVKCLLCFNEETTKYSLCKDCFSQLKETKGQRCSICLDRINTEGLCKDCLKKQPFYTRLYSPYVYDTKIKELILKFKSGNNQYMKEYFAQIALDNIPVEILNKCSLITNVPCSTYKLKKRGYDQAQLIAKTISKKTLIPYKNTLARLNSEKTALLNKKNRQQTVEERYIFCTNVFNETILLIDDVCTTGTTLRYCSQQLKKAGAKEVFCFTVARTDKV